MAKVQDILLKGYDLIIQGGDLLVADSDGQHVQHICVADKGQYKQYPLLGVGLFRKINGPFNLQETKTDIKIQLRADNFTVNKVEIGQDFDIDIEAERIV
jgi:hypothetical protein